jgi:hypothetical protein
MKGKNGKYNFANTMIKKLNQVKVRFIIRVRVKVRVRVRVC